MHARTKRFSVIGAALGLVLAAGVVVAPPAAPTASAAMSCASFKGLTTTGTNPNYAGVVLKTGEVIKATVSPARTTDKITLTAATTGRILLLQPYAATSGYTWSAPYDGAFSLSWTLTSSTGTASPVTWTFSATCSSSTVSPSPTPTATTKPPKGGPKGNG